MTDPAPKSNPTTAESTPAKPRKRGRWLRRGFFLLLLFGIGGWFAPTIIATTSLRQRVPKLLFPTYPGEIELGETSLGWLSPVVIHHLRATDEAGKPLLEVDQFSTSETLWTLATRPGNLGTLKVRDPVVHLALRNDGSNLEDVLAKFLSAPPSHKPAKDVAVEIDNARIELEHSVAKRKSTIDRASLRLVSIKGAVDELDLTIGTPPAANVASAETVPRDQASTEIVSLNRTPATAVPKEELSVGWLAAHFGTLTQDHSLETAPVTKHAQLRAAHWKLDCLSPLLPRAMPKAELSGELNADTSITLSPITKGFDWDWNGTISIHQLLIAGIDALQNDRLSLAQVELSGRAAATSGRLAMHDLKVLTDIGEFTATGDIPLDSNAKQTPMELVQSLLSDEDYHIDGRVDLKKLAALLPQTLRIRDGIEITAGDVKLQLVGAEDNGVRRWSGATGIVGLTALNRGQTVPWDKPLVARVNAHRDQTAIVVDRLECKSDFLQVTGNGTLDDAKFVATGNLSKLLENLERFVDLGIDQMAGQLKAVGELKRQDDDHVALTTKVLLDDFSYVVSKNNVWNEKHLELTIIGAGLTDAKPALTRINTGEIHLTSSGDTLDVVLQQPIDLTSKTPSYAANAGLKGNLTSWQNRLRPFAAANDWQLVGLIDLSTSVTADATRVDVSKFTIGLQKLVAKSPAWLIQDAAMQLDTTGHWDVATQKWTSPQTNLAGTALTLRVDNLECSLGKQGLTKLVGNAAYRANLKQLSTWKNDAIENPAYYLIGSLSGKANISQQNNVLTGNFDTQVEKMVIAGLSTPPGGPSKWVPLWKEPLLKIVGKGSYDSSTDKMVLESSSLDVDGLSIGAKGKFDDCLTKQRIDLTGDLAYDWDALVSRFGEQLGQNIHLSGKDHRPFSVQGSLANLSSHKSTGSSSGAATTMASFQGSATPVGLASARTSASGLSDLTGQAGLGWTAASVYGIVAGPGDISTTLKNGVCQFAPLDITVNEGKLHVTPTIHLDSDPYMLVLPAEKMIDQVRLSPELCSSWLKFVAPAMADSAQVEGKFSVDLQGASLPLAAPATGTMNGTFSIHQAQVRPGPTALQIVSAINQIQSMITRRQTGDANPAQVWLEMPEQQVPFKLDQGRMYNDGLTFLVKNVSVKTSGSVGLDETLNLVAEIGIRDEWLGNNKILASLKGQSISIPIIGTLNHPQIDSRVFASLAQKLGSSAFEGILQDKVGDKLNNLDGALNKGLDKLFGGKK